MRQCFYSSPLFVPLTPTIKLPGGPLLTTLKGHRDSVTSLCLQAFKQGKARSLSLVSGSMDKSLKTWELENGSVLKTLDGHTKGVTCIAVSSDAPYVASGSADCTIKYVIILIVVYLVLKQLLIDKPASSFSVLH